MVQEMYRRVLRLTGCRFEWGTGGSCCSFERSIFVNFVCWLARLCDGLVFKHFSANSVRRIWNTARYA